MKLLNLTNFNLNKKTLSINTLFAEKRLYLISLIPIKIIKILMVWRILITSGFKRFKKWKLTKSIDKKTTKMVILKNKIDQKIHPNYNQQKLLGLRNKLLKHKQLLKQNESINKSMLKYQFNSAVYYKISNFYWILRQEKQLKDDEELRDYVELLNLQKTLESSINSIEFQTSLNNVENSSKNINESTTSKELLEIQTQLLDVNQQIKEFEDSYIKPVFLDFELKISKLMQKHPTWSVDDIFQEYHIEFLGLMRRLWFTTFNSPYGTKNLNQSFNRFHTVSGFELPRSKGVNSKLNSNMYAPNIGKYDKQTKTWKDIFRKKEINVNRWNYNMNYIGLSKNLRFMYKVAIFMGFLIPIHYLLTGKWIQCVIRLILGSLAWNYINSQDINLFYLLNDILSNTHENSDINLVLSVWYVTVTVIWDWVWLGVFKKFRNSTGYFVFRSTSYKQKYIDDMQSYIIANPASKIYNPKK